MSEKVLLVDDDIAILQGYQRLLHREFQTDIAVGGAGALAAIASKGPYAVVVSDMRMPEMDGAQLLAKVKVLTPDTVRVMLTGNADIQTAVSAVNEGNIFRFLTKPCNKETMAKTLTASLMQHRLVIAEKELLENTLRGSIQVLTEVLSLVNPAAFGRAQRLRRYIHQIVTRLQVENPWRFEIAAMMSQLGCVTIDPDTIDALYSGKKLAPEEQARYDTHSLVARDLLARIPRMEPIGWMIAHQNRFAPLEGDLADRDLADMRLGAELLRITLAFDDMMRKGYSKTEAVHRLGREHRELDPRILEALIELAPKEDDFEVKNYAVEELVVGMILAREIRAASGVLIASPGQEVTLALILKLKNLSQKDALAAKIFVAAEPKNAAVNAAHAGKG